MVIRVRTEQVPAKAGVAIRAPLIGVSAAGMDLDEAVENMKKTLTAWVAGLKRAGRLSKALKHRGLAATDGLTQDRVEVEVVPPGVTLGD